VECHTSKLKLLGFLDLTCIMVSVSYFCTTLPDMVARVAGWVGVGFFGLGFIAIPLRFFRSGPQVVINEEGIDDRRLIIGVIRWSDIRSLSIRSLNSVKFLCIELVEPEKYLARLPRWRRSLEWTNEILGFPAMTIGFTGLSPGIDQVWEFIQGRVTFIC
jgi:hypothetical protein